MRSKAEHRDLDERIERCSPSEPTGDQLELARLKRRKLMLKDQIQLMLDSQHPRHHRLSDLVRRSEGLHGATAMPALRSVSGVFRRR